MVLPTCVVIGAGVLGASVAVELARAGAPVTVVDAGRPGASATTFGWVGASHPGLALTEDYLRLNIRGVAAHRRWLALWGDRGWFSRTGCLTWHTDPAAETRMVEHISRLRAEGYLAETLDPRTAVERIDPTLRIDPTVTAVGWFPDEGYAVGRPMVGELLATAQSLGASIRAGSAVVGISRSAGRITGVDLADGSTIEADVVVVAGGTATPDVLELAGVERFPLVSPEGERSLSVGLLVTSNPLLRAPSGMLVADELMMRPDGNGRIMLHRDAEDRLVLADTPSTPAIPAARALLTAACAYIPAEDAEVETARIGIRPLARDFLPVVGRNTEVDGLYTLLTHSGVTLAPFLGGIVADEVLRGHDEPLLAGLRPGRFRR